MSDHVNLHFSIFLSAMHLAQFQFSTHHKCLLLQHNQTCPHRHSECQHLNLLTPKKLDTRHPQRTLHQVNSDLSLLFHRLHQVHSLTDSLLSHY
ncbi:hypothetical protein GDO81_026299 [Engystomops pustulosus]|uniref:Uncharacterized protein n=1 Tax=Engystomops pustulosus TaxID=76066 RepID=A0AAV6YR34_ENGPU|nr:hypothetical protein GDO81_026299 [Engystomops pustulosus]